MNKEELLAEIEDVLRTMPPRATLRHPEPINFAWLGRLSAAIEAWDITKTPTLVIAKNQFHGQMAREAEEGFRKLMTLLYQAQSDLRMKTVGPINSVIGKGKVFEYFDLVRRVIETAANNLFFIDNYLDADFVATYLPHVRQGVSVRLLGSNKITALRTAAVQFSTEHGLPIETRSTSENHGRFLIVDGRVAYASDASFKDGPRKALASFTEMEASLFGILKQQSEDLWAKGNTA